MRDVLRRVNWRGTPKKGHMDRPVIVQYWDADPPREVLDLMDKWRAATKEGFEYTSYDDASALAFIRQHYDRRTADAYLTCAVAAMRADLFRYCALLVRPGLYADADVSKAADLFPLYQRIERGLLFKRKNSIANDFMIVKRPADPLLTEILWRAINNIEERVANNVWRVTGPGIATALLKNFGAEHKLFKGFDIWPIERVRKYVRFNWKLSYKLGESHWVQHQNVRSIFTEAERAPGTQNSQVQDGLDEVAP